MMPKWLVLLALTVVLVGCGGGGKQASNPSPDDDFREVARAVGQFVTGDTAPSQYLDWQGVPLIPGFNQLGAVQIRGNESRQTYTVTATRGEFTQFYLAQMKAAGWELVSSEEGQVQGSFVLWEWRKGSGIYVTIQADFAEDQVTFTIIVR